MRHSLIAKKFLFEIFFFAFFQLLFNGFRITIYFGSLSLSFPHISANQQPLNHLSLVGACLLPIFRLFRHLVEQRFVLVLNKFFFSLPYFIVVGCWFSECILIFELYLHLNDGTDSEYC